MAFLDRLRALGRGIGSLFPARRKTHGEGEEAATVATVAGTTVIGGAAVMGADEQDAVAPTPDDYGSAGGPSPWDSGAGSGGLGGGDAGAGGDGGFGGDAGFGVWRARSGRQASGGSRARLTR